MATTHARLPGNRWFDPSARSRVKWPTNRSRDRNRPRMSQKPHLLNTTQNRSLQTQKRQNARMSGYFYPDASVTELKDGPLATWLNLNHIESLWVTVEKKKMPYVFRIYIYMYVYIYIYVCVCVYIYECSLNSGHYGLKCMWPISVPLPLPYDVTW